MMNLLVNVVISVWLTSSLFMVFFYINACHSAAREGKRIRIPLGLFLWVTFMPIVHTRKCLSIMRRIAELKAQRRV